MGGKLQQNKGVLMSDEVDHRLACATLVALRAALPLPHEALGSGYMLLPDATPVDREALVAAIADRPKPVRCVGLAMGGFLAAAAWTWTSRAEVFRSLGRPDVLEYERRRRDQVLKDFPHARLLFMSEGEDPVVLTPAEMFLWREHYDVLGLAVSWSWSSDDPLARVHGATAIVELARLRPGPPAGAVAG